MQMAEVVCQRIADDPPRDDFESQTVVRLSRVRPAPAEEDPYGVVEVGLAFRYLSAELGAVLTGFERQLGALDQGRFDLAELRRREAVEFGGRAANGLVDVADRFPEIPLPPTLDAPGIRRADDLPTDIQAYLFRSAVIPSQMDRVLALIERDRDPHAQVQQLPGHALGLADFFKGWDGRPESFGAP
jgi:hypothetical protein